MPLLLLPGSSRLRRCAGAAARWPVTRPVIRLALPGGWPLWRRPLRQKWRPGAASEPSAGDTGRCLPLLLLTRFELLAGRYLATSARFCATTCLPTPTARPIRCRRSLA